MFKATQIFDRTFSSIYLCTVPSCFLVCSNDDLTVGSNLKVLLISCMTSVFQNIPQAQQILKMTGLKTNGLVAAMLLRMN